MLKKVFDKIFDNEFGTIPEDDSKLRVYVEHIKDRYWAVEMAKDAEVESLKSEIELLQSQLNKDKSERERALESDLKLYETSYRRVLKSFENQIEKEYEQFDTDLNDANLNH